MTPHAAQQRAIATALGLLMAATTELHAHGFAFVAATLAAIAVLAGIWYRAAATTAVLLAAAALVASEAPTVIAALCGLCATGYLVLRHARGAAADTLTGPTVAGAAGFTLAGVIATSFPLQVPWLPLVAPLAVFVIFALATRPFWPRTGAK